MTYQREGTVEAHLKKRLNALGGDSRKVVGRGRKHFPDQFCALPGHPKLPPIFLAELKAPGKKPNAGQLREHARLRKLGVPVFWWDTKEKIDRALDT